MKYIFKYDILNIQIFNAAAWFVEQNPNNVYIISSANEELISHLKKYYSIKIEKQSINTDFDDLKEIKISIDHKAPQTWIDSINRPLFFPKLIVDQYYKNFEDKLDQVYFRGIFTSSRIIQLIKLLVKLRAFHELILLAHNMLNWKKEFSIESNKVKIIFTKKGRINESKFLNEDYFKELTSYKFIFCPSGDFKWTYRFFEAVLVGSVPVTSLDLPIYSNFYKEKSPKQNIDTGNINKNKIECRKLYEN